jgi:hypothetical protein
MAKKDYNHLPALLAPIAIESEGEVFANNEHKFMNQEDKHLAVVPDRNDRRPIVKVVVFSNCDCALEKMYHLIHRDMGSHLASCHKNSSCVCARIYAMQGLSVKECMAEYYAHLFRSSCHKTEIWVSSEGGTR